MPALTNTRTPLPTTTDEIIAGCRRNDLLSQERLYRLFYPQMIKICYRYAGEMDGAGIIYNNAMLKVFKGLEAYEENGKLEGWIKMIFINSCIDFCRSKPGFGKIVPHTTATEPMLLPEVFDTISAKEIHKLITSLPLATATVFNMFFYEGFTHKQIAEKLGISDGTSKWHVSEAKRLLKEKFSHFLETGINSNAAG
jgi:RNA polymerase sigma factor (sigma-70 family)